MFKSKKRVLVLIILILNMVLQSLTVFAKLPNQFEQYGYLIALAPNYSGLDEIAEYMILNSNNELDIYWSKDRLYFNGIYTRSRDIVDHFGATHGPWNTNKQLIIFEVTTQGEILSIDTLVGTKVDEVSFHSINQTLGNQYKITSNTKVFQVIGKDYDYYTVGHQFEEGKTYNVSLYNINASNEVHAVVINDEMLSIVDNADLSNITVDGTVVTGFDSNTIGYYVTLPMGTTIVPTVVATTADINANAVVTAATELPGVTTIKVTAVDGTTTKTYTVNFTVFSETTGISIGDYVVMGSYYDEPILWRCVDIDENGPLMLSDKILTIKPFDAKGTHKYMDETIQADASGYRTSYGSNLWETSNMRAWLNSTATAGNVTWPDGCPPTAANVSNGYNEYDQEKGFLADGNFTANEKNAIKSVTQKSLLNSLDEAKLKVGGTANHTYNSSISTIVQNYDTAYYHNVTDKMFLLDVKQANKVYQNVIVLGTSYYRGQPTQKAVDNSSYKSTYLAVDKNWDYWLRTPYAYSKGPDYVRYVTSDGNVDDDSAYYDNQGVRPSFYINLSSVIFTSGIGSKTNPYTLDFEGATPTPTPTMTPTPAPTSTPTRFYDTITSPYEGTHIIGPVLVSGKSSEDFVNICLLEGNSTVGIHHSVNEILQTVPIATVPVIDGDYSYYIHPSLQSAHWGFYTLAVVCSQGYETREFTVYLPNPTPTPTITPTPTPTPEPTPTEMPVQGQINIGDYVLMGKYYDEPIIWRCVDIDENGPLMFSDKIISIKPYDAGGNNTANNSSHGRTYKNGQYRKLYGSDFWEDSNMRSWLNSVASAGNVVWLCGNPPTADKLWEWDGHNAYANEKGFLAEGNFTESERSVIKEVTQKSLLNGYEYSSTRNANFHIWDGDISSVVQNYDTAYSSQVTDKMFLLDVKQVNRVYENRATLGDTYYVGQPTQKAVDNSSYKDSNLEAGKKWDYWLRSPYARSRDGYFVRGVSLGGSVSYGGDPAYHSNLGVRPAFYINLSSAIFTSGNGSETQPYSLAEEVEPYTINEITTEAGIVNINITNNNSVSGILIVASYKDNKLMDIEFNQINIAQGQTDTITSNISVPSGGTIKAFIWDSLNSKQPLSFVKIR